MAIFNIEDYIQLMIQNSEPHGSNWTDSENSIIVDRQELIKQNNIIRKSLSSLKQKLKITFTTPSIFKAGE